MPDPHPETELMLAVRDGSREAFEALYERFRKPLANYLYRLCWSRQAVEDLLQEVFLRVWKSAAGYEARARVSTWIFRIAHNLWIQKSLKKSEAPLGDADPATPGLSAKDAAHNEEREAVRKAIHALPQGEREVLILAEYSGFRYREISEILDIPVGTVKSRMHNALRHLREALEART